jgi:hypothetical protein
VDGSRGRHFVVAAKDGRGFAMKLENFINTQILFSPINWLIIIGVAAFVPFIVAVVANPPKNPPGL